MKIGSINGFKLPAMKFVQNSAISNYMSAPALKADSVSFTSRTVTKKVNVDLETAEFVANSLSHSTSGHRATYGSKTFNSDVVNLITLGVADYAKQEAARNGKARPSVLIGGDTRMATRESLPLINNTLLKQNVDVVYIQDPVPTPLLALAAKNLDADVAVLMTASHNPWEDGGYNIVTKAGAVAPASVTQQIAENMINIAKRGKYTEYTGNIAKETDIYPIEMYKNHINSLGLIDWDKIKEAGITINYDDLQGTGGYVLPKILETYGIPVNKVHSSGQKGPNPNHENLGVLEKTLAEDKDNEFRIGIANDGDADRFGIVDENGNFVPANDVLLLAAYHLAKNKGFDGTIIRSQATTKELDSIADIYNLGLKQTPVGFKFIAEDILDLRNNGEDILIAGEESGGMTVKGHIPEKDGILADLLLVDLMATEKKPISQLLTEVKSELPVHIQILPTARRFTSDSEKQLVMDRFVSIFENAKNGDCKFDDTHEIDMDKTLANMKVMEGYKKGGDGIKLYLTDDSTILLRKSGTEPLLRCYVEAAGKTQEEAAKNCEALQKTIDKIFTV